MQLSGNNSQIHGTKSPPTPMVQTSVSASHSRNVSQSSGTSNSDTGGGGTTTAPTSTVAASNAIPAI